MKNEIAVVSAFFPVVQPYIADLISSLVKQTCKEFDWVVINDGGNETALMTLVNKRFTTHVLDMRGVPPGENRWRAIRWCKQKGYKYLIFQDSDDWMSKNRIERSVEMMCKAHIVFCDLTLVGERGEIIKENIWAERFNNNLLIDHGFITNKNCVGLGNAAIDLKIINEDIVVAPDIIATDWFLFYQFMQNTQAGFIYEPVYYRQYGNNLAGKKLLSRKSIKRCIDVKHKHYSALVPHYPPLKTYALELDNFIETVYSDKDGLEEYIYKHASKSSSSFWWEETNYDYE